VGESRQRNREGKEERAAIKDEEEISYSQRKYRSL